MHRRTQVGETAALGNQGDKLGIRLGVQALAETLNAKGYPDAVTDDAANPQALASLIDWGVRDL